MVHKYNIDDLKYIYSLKYERNAIVYYDKNKHKYVDINSNTAAYNNNIRLYDKRQIKLICDLNQMFLNHGIWVTLIDSHGKMCTELTTKVINNLMLGLKKILSLNSLLVREIDYICNLVTEICISNLVLSQSKKEKNNDFDLVINGIESCFSKEKEIALRDMISKYIFIDIAMNGIDGRRLIINKENNLIDYKILRILKYLGLNINVEDIPNFKIEYNLEGINYYDSKGNKTVEGNLDKEEVEKVKKFVDKRSI